MTRKKVFIRFVSPILSAVMVVAIMLMTFPAHPTMAQIPPLDPNAVRAAVQQMGMDSLNKVIMTDPPELLTYVRSTPAIADPLTTPATVAPPASIPTPRAALLILGKALFWDQQTGSDGQACATCHFHAGVDNRVTNSLNPGARNTNATEATKWNHVLSNPGGSLPGPNYTLVPADFPFHKVADPLQTNYKDKVTLFDTDDVVGSTGTFHCTYAGSPAPNYATANAQGTYDSRSPIAVDPVFNVGGKNTRSNGPRQASPTINAMFNFSNFWDGRAHNIFNGVNPLGPLDPLALIWTNNGGALVQAPCIVSNSSLASQATGPPNSAFSDEMAFAGRTMPDLGRKMLRLTATANTPTANIIPLGAQLVSPTDSVLGPFKNPGGTNGGRGINQTYVHLIQWAFNPMYWDSTGAAGTLTTPQGYQLMESNFALFWGLAIQEYENTLRADQTPYDRFMAGDNTALTQDQMRGLLTYIHTESTVQQPNPIFNNINFGACQLCHSGPELTEVSLVNVPAKFFITVDMTVKMDHNRELAIVPSSSSFDVGFTNVGQRPTREDIGRGGTAPNGRPLSFWRQFLAGLVLLPGPFVPLGTPAPNPDRGSNTDGAMKIPSLRNIELSGPYFVNGGFLTLKQAVEFYARHGDFGDVNEPNIDVGSAMVNNIGDADADLLVNFMLSLTDDRVRFEQAPFDHPQLIIPNGHPASGNNPVLGTACFPDNYITLPAVGATGGPAIQAFMGISNTHDAAPNNDQFDP